jgi:hypothetical protein
MGGSKGRIRNTTVVSSPNRRQTFKQRFDENTYLKEDFTKNGGHFKNSIFSDCRFAGWVNNDPEQSLRNYGILLGTYGNIVTA